MATAAISTSSPDRATIHAHWKQFFLPEGEAMVARRQELGDYICNPARAAGIYANFAAFDAMMKGPEFQQLDLERGRRIGEIMAGLPSGLEGTPGHRAHMEALAAA